MVSISTVGMLLLFRETLTPTAGFYPLCLHDSCHIRVLLHKLITKIRLETPKLLTSSLCQVFVSILKTLKKQIETNAGMLIHRFIGR